jgi:hypothetical protein
MKLFRSPAQSTGLINELYLRLTDLKQVDWQSRAHFFALCALQMGRILTDQARARRSQKRGGGAATPRGAGGRPGAEYAGQSRCAQEPSRELRFFGGLNVEETAENCRARLGASQSFVTKGAGPGAAG